MGVFSAYLGAGAYVTKTYAGSFVDAVTNKAREIGGELRGAYEQNKKGLKETLYWAGRKTLDLVDSGKNLQRAVYYKDGDQGITGFAKSGARGFGLGIAVGAFLPDGVPEKESLPLIGMQLDTYQYCLRFLAGRGYHGYVKPAVKFLGNLMKGDK